MKLTNEEKHILVLLIEDKLEEIYNEPESIKSYWKPELLQKILKTLNQSYDYIR